MLEIASVGPTGLMRPSGTVCRCPLRDAAWRQVSDSGCPLEFRRNPTVRIGSETAGVTAPLGKLNLGTHIRHSVRWSHEFCRTSRRQAGTTAALRHATVPAAGWSGRGHCAGMRLVIAVIHQRFSCVLELDSKRIIQPGQFVLKWLSDFVLVIRCLAVERQCRR